MQISLIYGLFDPIDWSLRYIGHTSGSLAKRLSHHVTAPTNGKVEAWIDSLTAMGLRPVIERLDTCDRRYAARHEAMAMERYKSCDLLNHLKLMT